MSEEFKEVGRNVQKLGSKYYTPEIEDLRVGYECEFTSMPHSFDPNDINKIINDNDVICDKLNESELKNLLEYSLTEDLKNLVRTPYLTERQIIAEGWKPAEVYPNSTSIYQKGTKENGFEVIYNFKDKKVMFRKLYFYELDEKYSNTKLIHNSLECNSINEFRFICKLLQIN